MLLKQAKIRPRNGQVSKPTKKPAEVFRRFVCRCSQLRRAYFEQGRTIDREGQYPWVLASGGVKPLRKSRRLNLAHLPACAVTY